MFASDMPEASFDKISGVGFADIFGDGITNATKIPDRFRDQNNVGSLESLPNTLEAQKFMAFFQTPLGLIFGKQKAPGVCGLWPVVVSK